MLRIGPVHARSVLCSWVAVQKNDVKTDFEAKEMLERNKQHHENASSVVTSQRAVDFTPTSFTNDDIINDHAKRVHGLAKFIYNCLFTTQQTNGRSRILVNQIEQMGVPTS